MKRIIAMLAVSLGSACFCIYGRNIAGRVVADNDSSEIVGAMCRLLSEGNYMTSASTDDEGRFLLKIESGNDLSVEISMPGYNPTEILIESGTKNIDIGTIFLSEGISLSEVVVTGATSYVAAGRTVMFPSTADIKASPTAISLFQKLPLAGLQANPVNLTLSVDGGTPMILINGVPSSAEDLRSIQPHDIERIEFSRITPARYADRGFTGFLSITLKKRTEGGSIYFWGRSALNTAFMDGNINFSYHQGASQFTLGYNPSWRNYQKVYDNETESYIAPDFKVNLESHDRNPFNYNYHNLRLKYDYIPNSRTLLSATLRTMPTFNKLRKIGEVTDSETGDYSFINHTTNEIVNPSLDIFFRYDFDESNSLEIEEVGTISRSKYRYLSLYDFKTSVQDYSMDANSNRNSLISEISYVHTFNKAMSLSAGFQNTVSHSQNAYIGSDYKPVLTENNNYFYAKFGQTIGKVYYSLSTGVKLFWIENDLNKRHFIRNLSEINLTWNISDRWNINGSITYRPSIPSLTSLTDYPQQKTPYLIVNGNPDLKVSETLSYKLSPTFKYKKFTASILLAYNNVNNKVVNNVTYLGDGLFLQQSENMARAIETQSDFNLSISDVGGFGANFTLSYQYFHSHVSNWHHSLNSLSSYFTLWWNKGSFTIYYWRTIPGKYLDGFYVSRYENNDGLSVSLQPGKHWTIEMSWMYMFDKKGTKYPMWSYSPVNPSYKERHISNNGNMIVLSVSYNTDFGSIFRTGRRSLNNSDNASSLRTM